MLNLRLELVYIRTYKTTLRVIVILWEDELHIVFAQTCVCALV